MKKRAIVLFTTLVLAVVMMMLTGALIRLGILNNGNGSHFRDRVRARDMALGGLNHITHLMTYDSSYASTVQYTTGDEGYRIEFGAGKSINNLQSSALSAALDRRGQRVPPYTADVVVDAWAGSSHSRIHAVLAQGYFFQRSIGADGQVDISGSTVVNGIVSTANPTPAGGGIFSNHKTVGTGDPAIKFTGNVTLSPTSVIEARPASGSASSIVGLPPAYSAQAVQAATPTQAVPQFQVGTLVNGQAARPAPTSVVASGANFVANHTVVADDRYVGGNLTVVGDINLNGGSLFVHGDLVVNGGIAGTGSVFVDGNVSLNGGTSSVRTNQSSGAALYSSGDVRMQGLDAYAFLQSLAAVNPSIAADQSFLQTNLANLASGYSLPVPSDVYVAHNANGAFESPRGPLDADPYYRIIPIPGPRGNYAWASGDNPPLQLAADIRATLGPGLGGSAQARQLVNALEELAYDTRMNFNYMPVAWVPSIDDAYHSPLITKVVVSGPSQTLYFSNSTTSSFPTQWDDGPLMVDRTSTWADNDLNAWDDAEASLNLYTFARLSVDHQARAVGGTAGVAPGSPTPAQQAILDVFTQNCRSFVAGHSYDLKWMSDSTYQGLIFAGGNVDISNRFQIVGAVLSNGNVTVTGNSTLTYNQEYFRQQGTFAPLEVRFVEDL